MGNGSINIAMMQLNEIQQSAHILSIAMLDNPLHVAVLRGNGEEQRRKIEHMFIELFNKNPRIIYVAKAGQRIVGVMRMKSCCGATVHEDREDEREESEIDQRIKLWLREWAVHDPPEQHWHLGPIGVVPTHQDQGIGSMLMKLFCEEVDKCSASAYLETDLDKNVCFYEKFGFRVVSTSTIFGVESRYMVREATTQNHVSPVT